MTDPTLHIHHVTDVTVARRHFPATAVRDAFDAIDLVVTTRDGVVLTVTLFARPGTPVTLPEAAA